MTEARLAMIERYVREATDDAMLLEIIAEVRHLREVLSQIDPMIAGWSHPELKQAASIVKEALK
jgi:hypothetical protein